MGRAGSGAVGPTLAGRPRSRAGTSDRVWREDAAASRTSVRVSMNGLRPLANASGRPDLKQPRRTHPVTGGLLAPPVPTTPDDGRSLPVTGTTAVPHVHRPSHVAFLKTSLNAVSVFPPMSAPLWLLPGILPLRPHQRYFTFITTSDVRLGGPREAAGARDPDPACSHLSGPPDLVDHLRLRDGLLAVLHLADHASSPVVGLPRPADVLASVSPCRPLLLPLPSGGGHHGHLMLMVSHDMEEKLYSLLR